METRVFGGDFGSWQRSAREALRSQVPPPEVLWRTHSDDQNVFGLFAGEDSSLFEHAGVPAPLAAKNPAKSSGYRVPRDYVEIAKRVACHRDSQRWDLLYRLLWRLTHGESHLMDIATDPDVIALHGMDKAIRRDVHKMRAFVRFREVATHDGPWFIAWFEPHHLIVELNAPFFVDRFAAMKWSILTPDRCAHWNGIELTFSPGVTREHAPSEDETENLWRTYYQNIFNPARVKIGAMKKEMAPYYWHNLPEARDIRALLAEAPLRATQMIANSDDKIADLETFAPVKIPAEPDLEVVRSAAANCRGCPLWKNATCTVFGEGPSSARVLVVGEQPGDQEDRAGKPFVGPAGLLLKRALIAADVNRADLYLTNAVKHFKWEPQGKRRLHQKPNAREIAACRPWLAREIELVRPDLIVCLGGTAAQSVVGSAIKVTEERGRLLPTAFNIPALITVHPSSLLRQPDKSRAESDFAAFVQDLRKIRGA